jgi:hypothetical protein
MNHGGVRHRRRVVRRMEEERYEGCNRSGVKDGTEVVLALVQEW